MLQTSRDTETGLGINISPVLLSEPGSVGDFCTTDRIPKKLHLSPPPPSFPPMSVLGLGLWDSGVATKGAELSWNQFLLFQTTTTYVQTNHSKVIQMVLGIRGLFDQMRGGFTAARCLPSINSR